MKIKQLALAALATLIAGGAFAQAGKTGAAGILSNRDGSIAASSFTAQQALGGAARCLDVTGIQSWDGIDDADNIVMDLDIGAGNELEGASWDVNIATVGASWLSEASVQFSDSNGSADPNAINLAPGAADGAPGAMDYSSGGIVLFSSVPLPNIVAGADGILRLQFFEGFDDVADAVDADWAPITTTPAVCAGLSLQCTDQAACDAALSPFGAPAQVPTLSLSGLVGMALLLMLGAVIVLRRQRG